MMLWKPLDCGSANSASVISARPSTKPTFLPSLSISGPTPIEAMIRPSAWVKAIWPSWLGVRWKRAERSGRMVPNMAAIIPYTKMARIAARINMDRMVSGICRDWVKRRPERPPQAEGLPYKRVNGAPRKTRLRWLQARRPDRRSAFETSCNQIPCRNPGKRHR